MIRLLGERLKSRRGRLGLFLKASTLFMLTKSVPLTCSGFQAGSLDNYVLRLRSKISDLSRVGDVVVLSSRGRARPALHFISTDAESKVNLERSLCLAPPILAHSFVPPFNEGLARTANEVRGCCGQPIGFRVGASRFAG